MSKNPMNKKVTRNPQIGSYGSVGYAGAPGVVGSNGPLQTKYVLMGEEITVDDYPSTYAQMLVAAINSIGWKYYEELLKQGYTHIGQLADILENRYRDYKISSIIE